MGVMLLFGIMAGIFVGVASAGYMFIHPIAERDELIEQQKEENLQMYSENKELRAENEDLRFDLSVANEKIEQKDEIVSKLIKQAERNSYNNKEVQLNKIKKLAKEYQAIN